MRKAYSTEVRAMAILAVAKGERKVKVARTFCIPPKTLYLWCKEQREKGKISPIKNYQKGYGHKIKDLCAFKDFVVKNHNCTSKEMAQKWGNISASSIKRYLKKINFTRKKRPLAMSTAMKRKEKLLR